MDDLISKQAAIRVASGYCHPANIAKELEKLPSAQPERKRGKWINNSPVTMKCDQCGYVISDWKWHESNFCPNCGADMRVMDGDNDE